MTSSAVELPLRAVERLGRRTMRDGMYIGLIGALLGHFVAIGGPQHTLWQMRLAVTSMNHELRDYFAHAYDVEVVDEDNPEQDALPPPLPDPPDPVQPEAVEHDRTPQPAVPEPDDPYPEDEPAAAAAAQDVVNGTAPSWSIPDKDGSNSRASGMTSGDGTRTDHVDDPEAEPRGKGRGKSRGTKRAVPHRPLPAPRQDHSRAASVKGTGWSCPWPAQADLYQVDHAAVSLRILVGTDGRAQSVTVNADPGHGFGAMARRCAMGRQYIAAREADGDAVTQSIQVRVTFRR